MNAALLFQQGIGRHQQGDFAGAERLYRQALVQAPDNVDAQHMLAVALAQQKQFGEASRLFEALLAKGGSDALLLRNYANALRDAALLHQQRGEADAALTAIDRALALQPSDPAAQRSRADILQGLGEYRRALQGYDQLLAAIPGDAEAWNNRGLALRNLGEMDEADRSFRQALALAPGMAAAELNIGLSHLLAGDFAAGLPLYEARKRLPQPVEARNYPQPLWTGDQDIRGKHLFCYIEQGLGDTIQFFRFIKLLEERGARITLSIFAPLMRLLRSGGTGCELIGWGEAPPQFDFHIPLMSVPLALGLTLDTIPAPRRYLAAEPDRAALWREKLGGHGRRIGLAWRGNKAVTGAEGKEFPLAALGPLAAMPGVRLIALQKDAGAQEFENLDFALERYPEMDAGPDAFLDSAAVIENLELVITADSAPAHLAGALGAPVWIALKHVPDWRWLLTRADCPWYPSARLFRQAAPGDWDGVFAQMAQALPA
jgi:Flp pilus assembly protein TadD